MVAAIREERKETPAPAPTAAAAAAPGPSAASAALVQIPGLASAAPARPPPTQTLDERVVELLARQTAAQELLASSMADQRMLFEHMAKNLGLIRGEMVEQGKTLHNLDLLRVSSTAVTLL